MMPVNTRQPPSGAGGSLLSARGLPPLQPIVFKNSPESLDGSFLRNQIAQGGAAVAPKSFYTVQMPVASTVPVPVFFGRSGCSCACSSSTFLVLVAVSTPVDAVVRCCSTRIAVDLHAKRFPYD